MGTVHGEDLPYVFGAPLVDGFSHFPRNYTKSEVALSEALMVFWSNFARTGNPNEHHRQDPVLIASKERNRFRSIVWDEYDPVHQKYLEIGKCHLHHCATLSLVSRRSIGLNIYKSENHHILLVYPIHLFLLLFSHTSHISSQYMNIDDKINTKKNSSKMKNV